jgi:Trk K+ transport system NAD-binding subunit
VLDLLKQRMAASAVQSTIESVAGLGDIVRAYNHAIAKRAQHQHRAETLRLGKLDGVGFAHITVSPEAAVVGQRVSEVELPEECLIVSVRRGRKLHVAHGYTTLQAGDIVTVFSDDKHLPTVQQKLTGMTPPDESEKAE